MTEQRKGRRVLIRRAVDFSWGSERGLGWGRDIGLGGMFVQSAQGPAPGEEVSVTVRFRRAPSVSIPGRVCRSNERGFAVHFEALCQTACETIKKVVES